MAQEPDLFRDTWVRYLGYANEVGESLRVMVPAKLVRASYGVAFAYMFADTAHKSFNELRKSGVSKSVLVEAGDVLIWQTLASIVIPGFTINRICAYSLKVLSQRAKKLPVTARNLISVGIGMASIPIIVHPIDGASTAFMDLTYRKYFTST